ncbi:MAG TPA: potassium channel family protein [Micromonosporaceae bacterium]|nr:potassium channel family protein [Micromonosporaceae bacterium]
MRAVSAVLGVLLAAAALFDVWTTILHPDGEGPIARLVRSAVWRASSRAATRWPAAGRRLLAHAGPLLLAGTLLVWMALLNLGVALIVWSNLDGYHAIDGAGRLGFVDALYYTVGTTTVLGYGDILPTTTPSKLLGVVVAALGFTLFTGLTTYLIQVINGLAVRNQFALAVHDQTQGLGGAGVVARSLAEEGVESARRRCEEWAESLRALADIVHRYPIAALTYRSSRRIYDLEPVLHQLAEACVAALLAARAEPWRGLNLAAEQLSRALLRLQETIADRYLPADTAARLNAPHTTDPDQAIVARINRLLVDRLGPEYTLPPPHDDLAAEMASRSRIFLESLWSWAGPGVAAQRPDRPDTPTGPGQ